MDWRERISFDAKVCHGKACVRGTRVLVSTILDSLADGEPSAGVAAAFHITQEDVHAALSYAATLAKDEIVSLNTPAA